MPFPRELDQKNLSSFEELIVEAERLHARLNITDPKHDSRYREWVVKSSGFISMLFGNSKQGEKYQKALERNRTAYSSYSGKPYEYFSESIFREKIATLKGLRHNYINGYYVSLEKQIIANVSADYMEQAEALLGEGIKGKFDHVPAAVLCGAVLENRLRSFCEQQEPPINVTKRDGSSKTLGPLIGELEKRKTFNKLVFKNLKSWSDIRNSAAHGRFNEFTRHDVEFMLSGVQQFLVLHL